MPYRYKLVRDYEAERQDEIDAIVQRAGDDFRAKLDRIFADQPKRHVRRRA